MNFPQKARLLALLALLVTAMLVVGIAQAQEPTWCVSPDPAVEVGCAAITLSPAGTTADFYNGDLPLAAGVNPAQLLLSPGTTTVAIRNIQSIEEGFGTLFTYADTSASVTTTAGQIRASTVTLRKTYIRGTLNVPCAPRGVNEGEEVFCTVAINGIPQAAPIPAGGTASYILDPGSYTVTVTLGGASASLFSPAVQTKTLSVSVNRTTAGQFPIERKGHLTAVMDKEGLLADYYLNGELVGTQVPSIDLLVDPNKTHKVDVKNVSDPLAGDIYIWRDATTSSYVRAGQDSTLTLRMQQTYLKGFLSFTCNLDAYAGEAALCKVTVDDLLLGQVGAGMTQTFNLEPGRKTLVVEPTGEGAFLWAPASRSQSITISAGRTTTFNQAFLKSGQVIARLNRPDLLGDFYVNGELVASGVNVIDRRMEPNRSQRIEVRNIFTVDPDRAGLFTYANATSSITVKSGEVREVTITSRETSNAATVQITCQLIGVPTELPAWCDVVKPNGQVIQVFNGQVIDVIVPAGSTSTIIVDVGPAFIWIADPEIITVTPSRGQVLRYTTTWQYVA